MEASPNNRSQLTEWGLPPLIINWFKKRGITSLFQWQVECLCKNDVLFGGNLVYSAPTSAGKTLVADFLLLKRVLEYNKKALVIEPYVALTREKASTLKSMLYTTKARVGAFGGSYYTPGGMAAVSVAVCTIEKANNFINKLINENKLSDLGIIVVDEIHYLGDESRGYQLELLLTKVLYHNSMQEKSKIIQIVGLSATLPNLESIAIWLNASLYVTGYRPVPLVEKIKIDDKIYDANEYLKDSSCQPLEIIDRSKYAITKDLDDICYICIDSILNGHSALIFCHVKKECEILAINIATQIRYCGRQLKSENPTRAEFAKKLRDNISGPKLLDVLEKLKKSPAGIDKELEKSLNTGVAFHHAGLTSEEREIIEDGFKGGAIKILTATSTLSSGVNLPARKVIIQCPTKCYRNGSNELITEMLDPTVYRQMIGRAGRKNMDTFGESILICKPDNQEIALKLVKSSLGNISSSLGYRMIASEGEPSGLKKAVLEVIANSTARTKSNLDQYLRSTFWLSDVTLKEDDEFKQAILKTIRYLISKKFIEELKPGVFRSTRLGNAVLASGLHPDDSLELLQDLTKARQGFCLLSDLHIIYQVTPIDIPREIDLKDWQHYSKVWNNLDEVSQSVGERVGIDEARILRNVQGYTSSFTDRQARIYRRFWVSLVINDLINEIPLPEICDKYRIRKSVVQQAQRAVAQFAGVMSIFCEELGYGNLAALVKPLESRINFSCQRDLLDLIKLNITRPIARTLFNAGYRNVIAVAKADKFDLEFVIRQTKPFKKDSSFSNHNDDLPFLWVPELAKNMTTIDYASYIVESARNLVEIEYDIDLTPVLTAKRKDEEVKNIEDLDEFVDQPQKRGRLEEDLGGNRSILDRESILPNIIEEEEEEESDMVGTNKDVPNFVVEYIDHEQDVINCFIDRWTSSPNISLNFKLTEHINEPIGGRMLRRSRRKQDRKNSSSSDDQNTSINSQRVSQDGLELRLDIDNKKHVVTRLYVCFGDDLTVYIAGNRHTLGTIRDSLVERLHRMLEVNQSRRAWTPVKLYTQNIVLTYKVLYAAFGMNQTILNELFEWHSFDVAWWMINSCPNRGLNNCNSSLSLIAKTKWARKYHHFLYVSKRKSRNMPSTSAIHSSPKRSHEEFLKLKDIVKSGKTAILKPLINEFLKELSSRNQINAYFRCEIPSRLTMAQMMVHGIGLNMKSMKNELNLYDDLLQQLTDVAQKCYAKSTISLTNIRHVARVLYQDLDLKKHLLEHSTNADISKDPTNAEVLSILSNYHPFPKLVQDFRKIGKALEALQSVNTHARYNGELDMMRVFGQCDFWQLTGRVSMSDPDLFLINRNFEVVIPAHGNRPEEVISCVPRRCFVPVSGWILVSADYSQLELRLLAHFSNETNLLEILNRSSNSDQTYDVFKTVASKVYQKPIEEITSEHRQHAKQICYGIIYGMGNRSLSVQLGVDIEKAEEFRQDFFAAFPRIRAFTEELIEECAELGYVRSLLNRRRIIDGINSDRSSLRSRAERVAINTKIQSSASDIIKLAMQMVNQKILDHYENGARLVLEMHDELIYEIEPRILNHFARTLKSSMEDITILEGLRVKLLVNLKKGTDWSNLQNFTIDY